MKSQSRRKKPLAQVQKGSESEIPGNKGPKASPSPTIRPQGSRRGVGVFEAVRRSWTSPTLSPRDKLLIAGGGVAAVGNLVAGFFSVGDQTFATVNGYESTKPAYGTVSEAECLPQSSALEAGRSWYVVLPNSKDACPTPGDVRVVAEANVTSGAELEWYSRNNMFEELRHLFAEHRVTPGAWIWLVSGVAGGLAFGLVLNDERLQSKDAKGKRRDLHDSFGPDPLGQDLADLVLSHQGDFKPQTFVADLKALADRYRNNPEYTVNIEALENLCEVVLERGFLDEMKLAAKYDLRYSETGKWKDLHTARVHDLKVLADLWHRFHVDGPIIHRVGSADAPERDDNGSSRLTAVLGRGVVAPGSDDDDMAS